MGNKMRLMMLASIALVTGLFLLSTAGSSQAATYTLEISDANDAGDIWDMTQMGFDPLHYSYEAGDYPPGGKSSGGAWMKEL